MHSNPDENRLTLHVFSLNFKIVIGTDLLSMSAYVSSKRHLQRKKNLTAYHVGVFFKYLSIINIIITFFLLSHIQEELACMNTKVSALGACSVSCAPMGLGVTHCTDFLSSALFLHLYHISCSTF